MLRSLLEDQNARDLFSLLVIYGQITYFGTITFIGGLIPHAAKSQTQKIYNQALFIILGVSLGVLVTFGLFSPWITEFVLQKPELVGSRHLILLYSLFIAAYNFLFLNIQYLLARNYNRLTFVIFFAAGLLFLTLQLFKYNLFPTLINPIYTLIFINLFITSLTSLYFTLRIKLQKL
jgi:O-antigen/teichoic acid export membrane protein